MYNRPFLRTLCIGQNVSAFGFSFFSAVVIMERGESEGGKEIERLELEQEQK